MSTAEIVMMFLMFLALFLVAYSYVGFPLVLWVWVSSKSHGVRAVVADRKWPLPRVSIVVAAYNEERNIRDKIENCLRQDYPKHLLEIIIASDGSSDSTVPLAREYFAQGVIVHDWERGGKANAQNLSVAQATGEIIVFTDADTILATDFVSHIVSPFRDPEVGCVDGELHYTNSAEDGITECEGLYWKMEMLTRRLEGRLGALPFVSGACFALRKALYIPVGEIWDGDVICPMHVLKKGYRVLHQESAKAFDRSKAGIGAQLRARARVSMRSLSGVFHQRQLLNPFKYPTISLIIFSHRLIRWWGPFLLIAAFLATMPLVQHGFFLFILILQLSFYLLALIGLFAETIGVSFRLVSMPFSFVLANVGFMLGTIRWLMGKKMVTWN